ncbi:MAG: hypothetical protein MUP45_03190 [Candidatus Marinimicrobia bacterium]|nr:hypothetical protein [Candidatus Neomarinimicrobiota bacterium]
MKKIILIFSALLLVLPFSVFGAVSYERTPAGTSITSPVQIEVSFGNWAEVGFPEEVNFWNVVVAQSIEKSLFGSNCLPITILSGDFSIPLPVEDYYSVSFGGGLTEQNCIDGVEGGEIFLEGDDTSVIFSVANFIPIGSNVITGAVAYINDVAVGIYPLLFLFIGVPLAFWVIGKVVDLFPHEKDKKKGFEWRNERILAKDEKIRKKYWA